MRCRGGWGTPVRVTAVENLRRSCAHILVPDSADGSTSALPRFLVRLWAHVEGPGAVRRQGPKELLHHLPAFVLRRPSVSAHPTEKPSGIPGSRLLDRRPPHYRCPAVPGFNTSARAILMALGSSVHPSVINCLPGTDCRTFFLPNRGLRSAGTAYCSSGLCQHRCHSPAASPVARPASALAWNPTAGPPGARARSRRLHRGTAHSLHCWSCSWRPLITAGHPVRSSVPSPSCNCSGFETPPPNRPAYCNCVMRPTTATTYFCLAVRVCRALRSFWLREKP